MLGPASGRRVAASNNEGLLTVGGDPQRPTIQQEIWALMKLTVPSFVSRVSFVAMKVTDTAVLGHVGTRYLDATALSDLWTSSTGVFIQSRVVGTFCGQAYGAGNLRLVGIWVQVAYCVLLAIMLPVALCWCLTQPFLRLIGNSAQESSDAGYYALVLAICLPVRILFSQLSSFFSAQKIMRPGAVCATSAMVLNLVGTLVAVLGFGVPGWKGFGFVACPWVTTVVEYLQFVVLWYIYCYRLQLHRECWPGFSMEHVTKHRVVQFLKMYLPAALSIGSDFWRVAAIGAVAKSMSPVDLGVFNISYRICWICLTFMGSLASAIGVQINIALGKGSVAEAKRSVALGLGLALGLLVVIGAVIVASPRQLGQIFSDDEVVLDLFEEVRWPLMSFVVLMNLAVTVELVPSAAGRVTSVFYAGLAGSWLGQVPGVIVCTLFWRKDLVGLFTGVSAGYGLLVVLYVGIVVRLDWDAVMLEARARSEVTAAPPPRTPGLGASLQASEKEAAEAEASAARASP